ncbi:putative Fe-S cluster assembly protein SufT, partial [Burkholderia thailandensis]|nr:putative Fe-S cluster assembly protein SufT [Burkholderia thailandensis]
MRHSRETVVLQRQVSVEAAPSRAPLDVPAGTVADITQARGTDFTLGVGGQGVLVHGQDAHASGKPRAEPGDAADDPV